MPRESLASRRARTQEIVRILEATYPDSRIALNYESPFQLMVAVILAAQCTDAMVNQVTPALFKRFSTPKKLAEADQKILEKMIFKTGFYRNKAKMLRAASAALVERHRGKVPETMEELLEIPGLGRKSANVLLGHCFNTPGVVVDTHVIRIANLLRLVNSPDPVKIEFELMKLLPREKWTRFGHQVQDHGRTICVARRPKCEVCPLNEVCPSAFIVNERLSGRRRPARSR